MLLISAIAVLTLVVGVGGWLGGLYLMVEKPPKRLNLVGLSHGAGGAAGFALTVAALAVSPPGQHAVHMGAGAFGKIAGALLAGALGAGIAILSAQLRRRPVSNTIVAVHGLLAISGYTLLVTYLTMLY